MDMEQLIRRVQAELPDKRWRHTQGVMKSAVELAKRYGGDPDKAELAALLHDYCKYWPVKRQLEVLQNKGVSGDLPLYDASLWHGPAAAEVVRDEFGIEDEEVLNAIRWHTSGRVGMSKLDKIVCLADYIEEGRDFPGVEDIRRAAESSLEEGLVAGFDSTIFHLLKKKNRIYPLTVWTRNALLEELAQQEGSHEG